MSDVIDITVPDIGDFDAVEVIELLVAAGDSVDAEDGILTLETDKASMDVPTTQPGSIVELKVAVGDSVKQGDVIATLRTASDDAAAVDTTVITPAPAVSESAAPADNTSDAPAEVEVAAAPPAAAQQVTVVVPDIGDFDAVDVIEVEVSVGDSVDIDDPLLTLETDKASMDVPSTHAGVVTGVLVTVGDQVRQGAAIVEIKTTGGAAAAAAAIVEDTPATAVATAAPTPAPAKAAPQPAPAQQTAAAPGALNEAGFSKAHASPSVRKLARELGVDLASVTGSGHKKRIIADDVKAWVKSRLAGATGAANGGGLPATPKVDFTRFGDVTEAPLTRIQKISGPRLQASWVNLPHVTQHDLADITDMDARRKALKPKAAERGVKLTPLAFIMRAVVQTLNEYPRLNASLNSDGTGLINKHYCHIGFAADTEDGLVVPVIHDADKMDVYELATALADLSLAARDGKLKANQMQGATFTISSLGGIGGTAFTPIVNAPEVGILGVSRSSMQPVWDGEQFQPRLMLPLSLSYDHRVVDGALAARFTTYLGQCLANVDGLMEAIP
ncbi:MAG: dihydrolipoyllysine-residue acetyltransferase [Pseudomonadota bacterium]